MATKGSGKATEENFSTVMQAEVMETQREFIDGWNSVEVLEIGPEEDDEEEDVDNGSDIEELDEDDLDEDDSDEDEEDDDDESDDED